VKTNIGPADRIIRLVIGCAILGAGYYFKSWWGLVGLLPITTGIVRFCPAYVPFGMSTCPGPAEKKKVAQSASGDPRG
jgi:hypothetical protein